MKISDLIRKLQILKEKHGDNELEFSVRTPSKRYGHPSHLELRVGEDPLGTDWFGTWTSDGRTRLEIRLDNDHENKKPHVSYRK